MYEQTGSISKEGLTDLSKILKVLEEIFIVLVSNQIRDGQWCSLSQDETDKLLGEARLEAKYRLHK